MVNEDGYKRLNNNEPLRDVQTMLKPGIPEPYCCMPLPCWPGAPESRAPAENGRPVPDNL